MHANETQEILIFGQQKHARGESTTGGEEKAAAEAINKMKQATRDGGNRATIETGDRKAEIKRDVRLVGAGARSRSRVDKEWKLQHPENGDGKAIRHNKDRSQDNVKNHCGRP